MPSTQIPNRAWAHGSSSKALGNSAGGSPAKHCASKSSAIRLHEVLVNQDPQLAARRLRDALAIGDDGMRKRRAALATADGRHVRHRFRHHTACILGVLDEVRDDL